MIKENISFDDELVDLNIETAGGYTVYDEVWGNVTVQVKRGNDNEELIGVEFVVTKGGNSKKLVSYIVPEKNQAKLYEFHVLSLVGGEPDSISIAPVFRTKTGKVTATIRNLLKGTTENVDGIKPEDSEDVVNCAEIVNCVDDDGCCPAGCDGSDNDCEPPPAPETCDDGIQNQDEDEEDCGGVCIDGTETLCSDGEDNPLNIIQKSIVKSPSAKSQSAWSGADK